MTDDVFDAPAWRVAAPSRKVETLDEWELIAALACGDLGPETFVCRDDWAEWLPAAEVEALANALPAGSARSARPPKIRAPDDTGAPPAPPAPQPSGASEAAAQKSTSFSSVLPYVATQEDMPSIRESDAPQLPTFRAAEPTLADVLPGTATTTLRPPRAVPPPHQGVPRTSTESKLATGRRAIDTPVPSAPETAASVTSGPGPSTSQAATVETPGPPAPSLPFVAEGKPEIRIAEVKLNPARPRPLDETLPSQTGRPELPTPPRDASWKPLALLFGAVSVMLAVALLLLLSRRDSPNPIASNVPAPEPVSAVSPAHAASPARSAVPTPPPPLRCRVAKAAQRLAPTITLAVDANLAPYQGNELLLGYAESRTTSVGARLDVEALSLKEVFRKDLGPALVGVVPLVQGGEATFVADRVNAPLREMRTIGGEPRLAVGSVHAGVAQWTRGSKPELVWEGDGKEPITVPRIATIAANDSSPRSDNAGDAKHLVAFRRGGRSGAIFAGWMGDEGQALSPLQQVELEAAQTGTPSVAAGEHEVALAFAYKKDAESAWRIAAARAPHGKTPLAATEWTGSVPAPGSIQISPALSPLSDGGWLLVWTEGTEKSYRVRAQALDSALKPRQEPLELSPPALSAGQPLLGSAGEFVAALFVVNTASKRELWGASLQCQ